MNLAVPVHVGVVGGPEGGAAHTSSARVQGPDLVAVHGLDESDVC